MLLVNSCIIFVTYKSLKMRRSFIMKLYDTGVYLQNGKEIIPAAET